MDRAAGGSNISNMYERRSGELLSQLCGEVICDVFDELVQSEMNAKCAEFVKNDKGYVFDAHAEEIRLEIKKSIWESFIGVFKILECNPEWFYEIESLFAKLYSEQSIERG